MKFRIAIFILIATLLSACNLTLAEDVTPPPGYVPPTPLPTLATYPAQTPNVENGKAIYAQKCAPCHGNTGMGDGPQGIQLGVTVSAFGLPEVARPVTMQQFYTTVTRGNMDRFMPPFTSLSDQERWDVVAYVMTLHTTPDQIAKGRQLFDANCKNCSTDFFKNQTEMSKLSDVDLARLARDGNDQVKAFGANLSDNDLWLVADYLRSLSFGNTVLAQSTPASASSTSVASAAATPSTEGTPVVEASQSPAAGEATQVAQPGTGTITGSIVNKTGAPLPSDLTITLRGFNHGTSSAQEVLTMDGTVNPDGTFTFNNVDMPEGNIFLADAKYDGITVQSEMGIVGAGQTSLALAPILLYNTTEDSSALVIDELDLFFTEGTDGTFQVLGLYNFRNEGKLTVAVTTQNQQEIPFLKYPQGAQGLGYETVQDSARLISMDSGFAVAPSDQTYGILAFSSIPRQKETSVAQQFVLPTSMVRVLIPDGMELTGDNFISGGPQTIQSTVYQMYVTNNVAAGGTINFTISGTAKAGASSSGTSALSSNNALLVGAGGIGALLVLAGVWLYWRERKRTLEEEMEEEEEFDSAEEVMDAIIALDDLHRARKISEDSYQKRREELKELLKEMM